MKKTVFFSLQKETVFYAMKNRITIGLMLLLSVLLSACFSDGKKMSEMEEYTGPRFESEDVYIVVSDSSVIKMEMSGARQLEFLNGDLEFPEGIKIVFYDRLGQKTSELTALRGYKNAKENLFRVEGDVIVNNLQKQETLSTEELFWDPESKTIYTEKFVTVETPERLIFAEGMDADQDFTDYEFRKIKDSRLILNDTQ